jgi:hypothetical protein
MQHDELEAHIVEKRKSQWQSRLKVDAMKVDVVK